MANVRILNKDTCSILKMRILLDPPNDAFISDSYGRTFIKNKNIQVCCCPICRSVKNDNTKEPVLYVKWDTYYKLYVVNRCMLHDICEKYEKKHGQ